MNETGMLILIFITGIFLGLIYFVGLWFTVLVGLQSKSPALWFIISFVSRTGVVMSGFYFLSAQGWERMLICLFGFITVRIAITKWAPWFLDRNNKAIRKEVNHESES